LGDETLAGEEVLAGDPLSRPLPFPPRDVDDDGTVN